MSYLKRSSKQIFVMCIGLGITQAAWGVEPAALTTSFWSPLAQDELHDPANPSLHLLHNPAAALSSLPRDGAGDQVNWVKALDENHINPRISLHSNTQLEVIN